MDERTDLHASGAGSAASVADAPRWRDLREWLELLRRHDLLLTIDAEVDPEEELGAVTFMTARQHGAPALLFQNLKNNRSDARILSNMLGASKERYALAVGLTARPVHRRDDRRHAASCMQRRDCRRSGSPRTRRRSTSRRCAARRST